MVTPVLANPALGFEDGTLPASPSTRRRGGALGSPWPEQAVGSTMEQERKEKI